MCHSLPNQRTMNLLDQDNYQEDYYEEIGRHYNRGRSRQAHRQSKQKAGHDAKQSRQEILAAITAENDQAIDFNPTYLQNFRPEQREYRWIQENLAGFYHDKIIADVMAVVKAGKEANVYRCVGSEALGHELIAAKIYRPRMFRHLRNDAIYKQGRLVRDQTGKEVRGSRLGRALKKKTRFGQDVDFATWIVHEFNMQNMLYNAGADVPKPIAHRGNTILMAFVGDAEGAANTLIDVGLDPAEAPALFGRILGNIELMLAHHYVHGDLSAYNILYWEGEICVIDFPQMADARVNPHAFTLLERDVLRVCDYFAPYGVEADPVEIAADLWQRWRDGDLE